MPSVGVKNIIRHKQNAGPVKPVTRTFTTKWQRQMYPKFGAFFWRRVTDPEFIKPSFWASDFKHRYLINTGRDYTGPLPASPAPGMYRGFYKHNDIKLTNRLNNHQAPTRESRHLPVMPMTPRVVYEYSREQRQDAVAMQRADKRAISEMKETEFHEWYMKLQRVRGKWCRENSIRSRGVYGPAVDAAELWG